jgi:hypothetical protein
MNLKNTLKFLNGEYEVYKQVAKQIMGHTKITVANGVSASLNPFNESSNDTRYSLHYKEHEC